MIEASDGVMALSKVNGKDVLHAFVFDARPPPASPGDIQWVSKPKTEPSTLPPATPGLYLDFRSFDLGDIVLQARVAAHLEDPHFSLVRGMTRSSHVAIVVYDADLDKDAAQAQQKAIYAVLDSIVDSRVPTIHGKVDEEIIASIARQLFIVILSDSSSSSSSTPSSSTPSSSTPPSSTPPFPLPPHVSVTQTIHLDRSNDAHAVFDRLLPHLASYVDLHHQASTTHPPTLTHVVRTIPLVG